LIIVELNQIFSNVILTGFTGDEIKLKISGNQPVTIGFLYSFIQKMKEKKSYFIKDYSAEKTTLEQIFNNFSQEKGFKRFNTSMTRVAKKTL